MKHLLMFNDRLINANLVTSKFYITAHTVEDCKVDLEYILLRIMSNNSICEIKMYSKIEDAEKDCQLLNDWLDQFIDYERMAFIEEKTDIPQVE